jgi:hypothetical protein
MGPGRHFTRGGNAQTNRTPTENSVRFDKIVYLDNWIIMRVTLVKEANLKTAHSRCYWFFYSKYFSRYIYVLVWRLRKIIKIQFGKCENEIAKCWSWGDSTLISELLALGTLTFVSCAKQRVESSPKSYTNFRSCATTKWKRMFIRQHPQL